MNTPRKICVVTGSRAEYGLLYPILREITKHSDLRLQIIATCMHLSPEFGLTYRDIEKDGFTIDWKVEMLLSSDTAVGISKSMGLASIGFADAYNHLNPDIVVLLGDRFELLSAASAALIARIPIAHIHGGETTEGAFDESIRHSITKMSHLHFTSTEIYKKRVIQLGENRNNIFNFGAPGIDNIKNLKLLSLEQFEKAINFKLSSRNIMVTFHPVTVEMSTAGEQFKNLLSAIKLLDDVTIIFTKANADTGGRIINEMIDEFVLNNSKSTIAFTSLGKLRYLSAIQFMDGIVGNSSSGLIEAPSFKVGTINIGNRQQGRISANSVIDCKPTIADIGNAFKKLFSQSFKNSLKQTINPYDGGNASNLIVKTLSKISLQNIIKKKFYDM